MQWIYNMTGFEDNGKVNIVGKGETPWSFTDQEDVSGQSLYLRNLWQTTQTRDPRFRCSCSDNSAPLRVRERQDFPHRGSANAP